MPYIVSLAGWCIKSGRMCEFRKNICMGYCFTYHDRRVNLINIQNIQAVYRASGRFSANKKINHKIANFI